MLLEESVGGVKEKGDDGAMVRGGGRACLCWIGWVGKTFGIGDVVMGW